MNECKEKNSSKINFPSGLGAVKLSDNPYGFPANKWLLYSEPAHNNSQTVQYQRSSFRLRDYLIEDKKIYFGVKKPVVYNQTSKVGKEEIRQYIIDCREIEKKISVINYEYWAEYLKSIY